MIGEAGFDDQDSISFTSSRGRIPLLAINTRQPSYEFNSSIDLQNEEEHDEEVGAVSRLWRYCEASEGEVKLILPDAVRVPYYLPRPRGMNKSSISIEERYLRILEKSTANSIVGAVARPAQQLPKRTRYTLSPREQGLKWLDRLVERRLMDKYRQDPELAKELLRKVQARGRGWHPPRPKKVEQKSNGEPRNVFNPSPSTNDVAYQCVHLDGLQLYAYNIAIAVTVKDVVDRDRPAEKLVP
eukprot:scaffold1522_cov174-Ochromonas_danica.AAC.3